MYNCYLRYRHSAKPHIEASFYCHDMFVKNEMFICENFCGIFSPTKINFLKKETSDSVEILAYEDFFLELNPEKIRKIKLKNWSPSDFKELPETV